MGVIMKNGISYGGGSGGSGTSDYDGLSNKPTLNGVVLTEGQQPDDLGLVDGTTTYMDDNGAIAVGVISNAQIQALFNS